jgi:hypothetical protein
VLENVTDWHKGGRGGPKRSEKLTHIIWMAPNMFLFEVEPLTKRKHLPVKLNKINLHNVSTWIVTLLTYLIFVFGLILNPNLGQNQKIKRYPSKNFTITVSDWYSGIRLMGSRLIGSFRHFYNDIQGLFVINTKVFVG